MKKNTKTKNVESSSRKVNRRRQRFSFI